MYVGFHTKNSANYFRLIIKPWDDVRLLNRNTKQTEKSRFIEEEMQRIYNKQERTGNHAKDNVKTIIVGYGKIGI